jgi:hypothetical protein
MTKELTNKLFRQKFEEGILVREFYVMATYSPPHIRMPDNKYWNRGNS